MGVLFDARSVATPSMRLEAAAKAARLARMAKVETPAASQVIAFKPKEVIPGRDVGYIPPPWIPPIRYDSRPTIGSVIEIRQIQMAVAHYFGVSRFDLVSSRRTRELIRPRQVAMYLSKMLTPCSLTQVGRAFGHRDHTTILWGYRKIETLYASDEQARAQVDEIRAQLLESQ